MTSLVEFVLEAHGGLERWRQFEQVSARLEQGGALWQLKGQAGMLNSTAVTVGLRSEWASHAPFGPAGWRSRFEPARVALEKAAGTLLEELQSPRDSFAGHVLETPWTALQLAYFAGSAMWTYLNTPFLLAWPGVETEEIAPLPLDGASWRRLRVRYPKTIAAHSAEQMLYVDERGLLKRHDYDVEIAGGTPGAHFMDAYTEVQGILFPTRRRIFPRLPDGSAAAEPLVVSIDLSEIRLS